jgi:hypothetical protein
MINKLIEYSLKNRAVILIAAIILIVLGIKTFTDLPVDVYVNGDYAFSFEFSDSVSTSLPAGNYFIEVKLAGTDTVVMSLGPTDIPAGVDVTIRATLSAEKTPMLKVWVK